MLLMAEQMEEIYFNKEKKDLYRNNIEKIDPVCTAEFVKKANREQMNPKNVRSTYTQSRSKIQSI